MTDKRKLDLWADKLLDTGKRNNLISFRDSKSSSAEILFPACDDFFSKCAIGHQFEVYRTPSSDDDISMEIDSESDEKHTNDSTNKNLSKQAFKDKYAGSITSDRYVLVYAQTPNPVTAVKNIAKKAKEMLDETGINVAYLAFGFIKWNEKEESDVYYRAPLLLVHINIITGSIIDPIKIEISDDDIVVNPTFNYLLQADYGLSLPSFEDGDTLLSYFDKVSQIVEKMGWEIIKECKIGTFSFLKINMYEDLKKNTDQILENESIKALLGEVKPCTIGFSDVKHVVNNPLIDLHTVVDADSSQIEAIEMAKSGKSFVLQGPPGTGKSQTITNIIAECLYDGKKVLFVSEKQAALNVVFDKLKKAGLADFCLELHSHKANKKAVIEELNRTLEVPKSTAPSIQAEISEKRDAQKKLDGYAAALHKKREVIHKSLYQLFEAYSAERMYPEIQFVIPSIRQKGQKYLQDADSLLKQYVEYTSSIGTDYKENAWYGFNSSQISYDERNQLRDDLGHLLQGFSNLLSITNQIRTKYAISQLNYSDTLRWRSFLAFYGSSDVITPMLLSQDACNKIFPQLSSLNDLSNTINQIKREITREYRKDIILNYDGQDLYDKLTGKYGSYLTRTFNGQYKNLM